MNTSPVNAVLSVDRTFLFIFGISAVILVLIAVAMLFFVIRYNHKRHPVAADFDHNLIAEVIWTAVPTLLVLAMFYYGWTSYQALRTVPPEAMEVKVTARMWSWSFAYENGKKSSELYVPAGKPVKLTLGSVDVIHGFYVPAFRIKMDAVPGMTTHAWFLPEQTGDYDIFCSVYCGVGHADMHTRVRVVGAEEFAVWLAAGGEERQGAKAVLERLGCLGCHSTDGSPSMGPSFKGLAGRSVNLVDPAGKERTVVADEAYLRRAVLGEKGGTVKGFEPMMPSYQGQIDDQEMAAILEFLQTGGGPSAARGRKVAEAEGCLGCHSSDGSPLLGPSFRGLFGGQSTVLDKGREVRVTVDEAYVLEVLADPAKRRVKGFPPEMPAYSQLSDEERQALVAYLRSLGQGGGAK
jgi:cytochrome c oxidase subunit 2